MLVTFKSKAAADIVMYKEHAKRLLDLLGKDVERGIITAAESGQAIEKLQTEISADRAAQASQEIQHDSGTQHGDPEDDPEHVAARTVSFATRAYPLLEMLRAAQAQERDVVWGV